jgi:hypothetical protein
VQIFAKQYTTVTNRQTKLQATHPDGRQVNVSETTTESPILPVAQLEQLQKIDPSLVEWVVTQTKVEADFRRKETIRINGFVFLERISGVIAGALVAIVGLCVSAYTAINGHDWVAAVIGGATLVTIVTVLVLRKPSKEADEESTPARSAPKKKPK